VRRHSLLLLCVFRMLVAGCCMLLCLIYRDQSRVITCEMQTILRSVPIIYSYTYTYPYSQCIDMVHCNGGIRKSDLIVPPTPRTVVTRFGRCSSWKRRSSSPWRRKSARLDWQVVLMRLIACS